MSDVLAIVTKKATEAEVEKAFADFMKAYKEEGCCLRMEDTGNLNGCRFTVVYDYDDMG
jgi:hypothetical protein